MKTKDIILTVIGGISVVLAITFIVLKQYHILPDELDFLGEGGSDLTIGAIITNFYKEWKHKKLLEKLDKNI